MEGKFLIETVNVGRYMDTFRIYLKLKRLFNVKIYLKSIVISNLIYFSELYSI